MKKFQSIFKSILECTTIGMAIIFISSLLKDISTIHHPTFSLFIYAILIGIAFQMGVGIIYDKLKREE